METNTALADDDRELDKNQSKNKEEMQSSGEEDEEDGSPNKLNSKIKINDDQGSYFNNGTEKAINMGADTEVTSVGVTSNGQNNVEGFDENVAEKSKSNKEQVEESTNKSEQVTKMTKNDINTKTEEATNMKAAREAIGIKAQSGLLNHVVGFHANRAATSKRTEEEATKVKELESMFEKEMRWI